MARTAQQPAFDINAYLASKETKQSAVATLTGNLSYRAGKAVDNFAGNTEVFALGRKVGAIAAAKRVDHYRQQAHADIEALLSQ